MAEDSPAILKVYVFFVLPIFTLMVTVVLKLIILSGSKAMSKVLDWLSLNLPIFPDILKIFEPAYVQAWQHLVDTGVVWELQGFFGRAAHRMLSDGTLNPAPPTDTPQDNGDEQ